ncbi:MAG: GatB/YqeY domain-containing protein [Flavobacteriaceae bacterium]
MSLEKDIMTKMKEAMKAKDTVALESLRAIKSAILLAKTESGASEGLTEGAELKILQKLVKQRKDSAVLYTEQGREDLAEPELAQAAVIEQFLPAQLSQEELEAAVQEIINQTGATSMKDMGKVMGMASKQLGGSSDGKSISTAVKKLLNS